MSSPRVDPPWPLLREVVLHPRGEWPPLRQRAVARAISRMALRHGCSLRTSNEPAPAGAFDLAEADSVDFDPLRWDAHVHRHQDGASFALHVVVDPDPTSLRVLAQLLTRYQRLLPLSADVLGKPELLRILRTHRELHDLDKPLVRADYDHALDTWRWLLRCTPDADLATQCAALFHDIERLESEAVARREHLAPDYVEFKRAHARRGAELLERLLTALPLDAATIASACQLVSEHERPGRDPRGQLVNDADGLSFLSLNSYGYLSYFGVAQTLRKIDYTLDRLGPRARRSVRSLHFHPRVRDLVTQSSGLH